MAENMDVHLVTIPLGAQSGATELPWVYLPNKGGAITVLSAHLAGTAAGTVVGGKLVTLSDAGTPALDGTIGSFAGTCVLAAGVVFALTVSTAAVGGTAGKWIGFDMASGTVASGTFISLAYTTGK